MSWLLTSEWLAKPLPQLGRGDQSKQDADHGYADTDQREDGFVGPDARWALSGNGLLSM